MFASMVGQVEMGSPVFPLGLRCLVSCWDSVNISFWVESPNPTPKPETFLTHRRTLKFIAVWRTQSGGNWGFTAHFESFAVWIVRN